RRGKGPGAREAGARGGGGGRTQHPDGWPAGLGENDAGAPAADSPPADESRRGARDDQDPLGGGDVAAGRIARGAAAVPRAPPYDLRRRADRRGLVSAAGGSESRARRRAVLGRAARVSQERARGTASA